MQVHCPAPKHSSIETPNNNSLLHNIPAAAAAGIGISRAFYIASTTDASEFYTVCQSPVRVTKFRTHSSSEVFYVAFEFILSLWEFLELPLCLRVDTSLGTTLEASSLEKAINSY
jgi:hypothetical protein